MSIFGFKAFTNDFTCIGFQYEIGKTYEIEGKLEICKNGFHFCRKLKDCFKFYLYEPETKLAVIEALGEVIDGEHKSVTNKIRIVKEIPFSEIQDIIKSDVNQLFDIEDGILKDCFMFVEGAVVIPDGVTSIEGDAFNNCDNLTSVIIPDSVTSIRDDAFYFCTNLTSITIPDSVTYIDKYAFYKTAWLKNQKSKNPLVIVNGILIDGVSFSGDVIIPDNVTKIANRAFDNCSTLTSVKIPKSVKSIEFWAFDDCTRLTDITILNPDCNIYSDSCTIYSDVTIHGYAGSTAEKYAKEFGRKFIPID